MVFNPLKRGSESREIMKNAGKGSAKGPFRFYIAKPKEANYNPVDFNPNATIIVLDDYKDPYDFVSLWEHNFYREQRFEVCTKEMGDCTHCNTGDRSTYVTYATVIDTRNLSKESTKGKYYRHLLPIKSTVITDFIACAQAHIDKHGTTRGLVLQMYRDFASDKAAGTGKPVEGKNAKLFDGRRWGHMPEAEIARIFATPAVKDDKGTVLKPANQEIQPYNYEKLFCVPDSLDGFADQTDSWEQEISGAAEQPAAKPANPFEDYQEDGDAINALLGEDVLDETGGLPAPGAATQAPVKQEPEAVSDLQSEEEELSAMFG